MRKSSEVNGDVIRTRMGNWSLPQISSPTLNARLTKERIWLINNLFSET